MFTGKRRGGTRSGWIVTPSTSNLRSDLENYLTYLGTELQLKLLPIFHYSLRPEGILFLGSSEAVESASELFAVLHKKWRIFRRKQAIETALRGFGICLGRGYKVPQQELSKTVQKAEDLSALQMVETIL